MKLMTKEIEKKLEKRPQGYYASKGKHAVKDFEIIVKYFNPYGDGIWLITEGEKLSNGDWLLTGYCKIQCWEYGDVLLSDLENVKINIMGEKLGLERDRHLEKGITVGEYLKKYTY